MIDQTLLNIIIILHLFFVVFIVVTPFIGNNYFLILHITVVPFMMAHWYLNDNNCALTLMEKKLREKIYGELPDPDDCFTYNLIAPVYDFKKNNQDMAVFIYIISISFWVYGGLRLYTNWLNGKLRKIEDLFDY